VPKYRLHPKAIQELDERRKTIASALGAHIISEQQAREQAWDALKRLIAQAMVEVADGESTDNVPIVCNGCGKVVVVAGDVLRYECPCSPSTERYTFQSRKLDLPLGAGRVEDYMAANTGRRQI